MEQREAAAALEQEEPLPAIPGDNATAHTTEPQLNGTGPTPSPEAAPEELDEQAEPRQCPRGGEECPPPPLETDPAALPLSRPRVS